ncbi:MAG: hypothetical protein ABWW65_01205 [Thermoprotei archaeon]
MWLLVFAVYIALLGVLDLVYNVSGLVVFGFTVVELGVFNAMWTLIYAFSIRMATHTADRGAFRANSLSSILALIPSLILFGIALNSGIKPLLYTSYALHAVAVSCIRVSALTSILEGYDSSVWSRANRGFLVLVLIIEGLFLTGISLTGFSNLLANYSLLAVLATLIGILAFIVTPQPVFMIERIMYRIEKSLTRMLLPVRALLALDYYSITIPDKLSIATRVVSGYKVSTGLVIIALVFLRISNEYLLTPLPYYLLNHLYLSINGVILVYGLAKLLAPLLLILVPYRGAAKGYYVVTLFTRLAAAIIMYLLASTEVHAVLLLVPILFTNTLLDTLLYSLYIESTYGYKTGYYSLVNEISGFMGSLTSGLLYIMLGVPAILVVAVLSTLILLALIRNAGKT